MCGGEGGGVGWGLFGDNLGHTEKLYIFKNRSTFVMYTSSIASLRSSTNLVRSCSFLVLKFIRTLSSMLCVSLKPCL